MQSNSYLTDLIQFKDEIFKTIRLLDNRLTKEINDKYVQSNLIFESINNRLDMLSTNNDSLLELLTSQKLNLDKIGELEKSNDKLEHNVITNESKLKQISSEIENLREKYDKIIHEHLQVSGYIGPGCHYKKISEYIRENISEYSKIKNDRERIKFENLNIKNKVEEMIKNASNLVDKAIIMCQKYSDRKHEDMKDILEIKIKEFNEKNRELKALISQSELKSEKIVDKLKIEIENIQIMKDELNSNINDKINEVNDKFENINKEIKAIKSTRKEYKSNRRSMISFNTNMLNRNSINMSGEEESFQKSISRKKLKEKTYFNKVETSEIIEKKINNNNDIKDLSSSLRDEEINIKNRMGEEKEKTSEEYTLRSFERIYPKIIMEEKKEEIKKIKIESKSKDNLKIEKNKK